MVTIHNALSRMSGKLSRTGFRCVKGSNLFSLIDFTAKEVNDFDYGWYNHVRPHKYNGGLTPYAA